METKYLVPKKVTPVSKIFNENTFDSRSNQFSKCFKISEFSNMSKIVNFCFGMVAFHKGPAKPKVSKKRFFRALTCLGVFSAAGGALKTKNSTFDSNLINFQIFLEDVVRTPRKLVKFSVFTKERSPRSQVSTEIRLSQK